ncbi:MAG: TerB family tellurite resistance protein [Bacteroidales bacterium]
MNQAHNKIIKHEHFANLVAIAYSDGMLDDYEKDFLAERAELFGLDRSMIEETYKQAGELQFMVPMNNEEREEQLSDIVYMAMINGEVHDKEYQLCLHIAEKLNFTKKDLDHIIDLIRKLWNN